MREWFSHIITKGKSNYFDENVFVLEKYFNIASLSILVPIYFTDISTWALNMVEPIGAISNSFPPLRNRYEALESVERGSGAFFLVANVILLLVTTALVVLIAWRISTHKAELPARLTKYNVAIIPTSLAFIYLYYTFLLFSDVTCRDCGRVSYKAFNSPLIIVVIAAFYSMTISVSIQLFSAVSVAFRAKENENRL
ncbi:hypothetical protein At1D1460_13980 [Agrobacterium tumefaciens]|nr:hypothetical protein At1D1460_13980 [Agrobacterium tumefaciens]